MPKSNKQNNNKGVFTPFTRPKVSEPKTPIGREVVGKEFSLQQILSPLNSEQSEFTEISWYYDLSTWAGYTSYLGSKNIIETPKKELTLPRTHVNIPYNT